MKHSVAGVVPKGVEDQHCFTPMFGRRVVPTDPKALPFCVGLAAEIEEAFSFGPGPMKLPTLFYLQVELQRIASL